MEQYSATCPHCKFVLQFYDASLFGRRGRCPKCRNKFVLNKIAFETPDSPPAPIQPLRPAREKESERSEIKVKVKPEAKAKTTSPEPVATTSAVISAPPERKAPPAGSEPAWEMDLNRGMELHHPTLPPRWVFPNVLSVTNLLVITIGASTGMGAISLLLRDAPLTYITAASTVGGLIAAAFLIRRHNPQR